MRNLSDWRSTTGRVWNMKQSRELGPNATQQPGKQTRNTGGLMFFRGAQARGIGRYRK
jgi:hypothetical protein